MEQEREPGQAKSEAKTSQGNQKWSPVDKYHNFDDFVIISGLILEPSWDLIPKKINWQFNVGIDTQTTAKTYAKIN